MADSLTSINTRRTPQSEQADPRQVQNNAGGYVFQTSDETKIHRFLTLGVEGGTYYQSERDLTKSAAPTVLAAARDRGEWLVQQIVEVSTAGRAPRQNPAIFALAAVAGLGSDDARRAALAALPQVCRIGTHLFLFARYVEQFRGWGRGLRDAVGRWYLGKSLDDLSYQVAKYRQREGWSHGDLLRLAHPHQEEYDLLFKWVLRGEMSDELPPLIRGHVEAMAATTEAAWTRLIAQHPLSWEMLPDAALSNANVWRMLIEKGLPQTALMRQLPRLTNLGVLQGSTRTQVVAQLQDSSRLKRGRVHPVNVLVAQKTYALGHGFQGGSSWSPVRQVVDALDAAFYQAFGAVQIAGKRTLLALDISGSMSWGHMSNMPLTPREVSAAMSLVTMATEPETEVVGFSTDLRTLSISPRQRLDDAVRAISNLPFGGTDCAQPMIWAQRGRREFDTFVVYTDNETWAGSIHPVQALRQYRDSMGIDARLAVVGITATDFTIADPNDAGSLDVAGFDAAVPSLIADFSRGSI